MIYKWMETITNLMMHRKDDVEAQIKVFIDNPEAMMEYTDNVLDLPE